MRLKVPVIVTIVLSLVLAWPPGFGGQPEASAQAATADPPAQVGRLNYMTGSVSYAPPGVNEWAPAILNYPLTAGTSLWTDPQARAEFHVGSTAVRMNQTTAIEILNLDEQAVQLRLSQGTIDVGLHNVTVNERFEVDTPSAAVSLLAGGTYRIDVSADGATTRVTTRSGDAEVATSSSTFRVTAGQSVLIADNPPTFTREPAAAADEFDQWALARYRQEQIALQRTQYVSENMTGFEDLSQYGAWRVTSNYGPAWFPSVQSDWAPYRSGQWVWAQPWGWTWVGAEPWGFAPLHFGRWVLIGGVWAWVPGLLIARPVFAPALVVFIVIDNFIGWFPLGFGDAFVPSFAASPVFVQNININITNLTVVINNIRRQRHKFAFQQVPGAVTIVPKDIFVRPKPVARVRIVDTGPLLPKARLVGTAAPVVPTVDSVLGGARPVKPVARPPVTVQQRPVVTRLTPPPAPVPFSAQQKLLAANPGRPLDPTTIAQLRQQVKVASPLVKPVSPPAVRESGSATRPAPAARPSPNVVPAPAPNGVSAPRGGALPPGSESKPAPVAPNNAPPPAESRPPQPVRPMPHQAPALPPASAPRPEPAPQSAPGSQPAPQQVKPQPAPEPQQVRPQPAPAPRPAPAPQQAPGPQRPLPHQGALPNPGAAPQPAPMPVPQPAPQQVKPQPTPPEPRQQPVPQPVQPAPRPAPAPQQAPGPQRPLPHQGALPNQGAAPQPAPMPAPQPAPQQVKPQPAPPEPRQQPVPQPVQPAPRPIPMPQPAPAPRPMPPAPAPNVQPAPQPVPVRPAPGPGVNAPAPAPQRPPQVAPAMPPAPNKPASVCDPQSRAYNPSQCPQRPR